MAEKLPNSEIIHIDSERFKSRLRLLMECKPKMAREYEAIRHMDERLRGIDPSKPMLVDALAKFAQFWDVDPLFFMCEESFLMENPDMIRPEED